MMNSFGSICPKGSSTPCSPKSGEPDDPMAPLVQESLRHARVIAEMPSPLPVSKARKPCCESVE